MLGASAKAKELEESISGMEKLIIWFPELGAAVHTAELCVI